MDLQINHTALFYPVAVSLGVVAALVFRDRWWSPIAAVAMTLAAWWAIEKVIF